MEDETEQTSQDKHWFLDRNPLLERIPSFSSLTVLADRLAFEPLKGLEIRDLDIMQKLELLNMPTVTFEPMSQSLQVTTTLLGMLRGGLHARNPYRVECRQKYWSRLEMVEDDIRRPIDIVPGNTSVLVIMGVTGSGKTALIKRYCSLMPQFIKHGKDDEAGWLSMTQLVYLYVNLSSDGSRGGFLVNILMAMDKVLETHYAVDLPKKYKTIDKLIVATVSRMHAHFTGMVIFDEGQLKNLMESDQSDLMQLFLLTIINAEIPLVLVGNPLAFGWIDNFSQNVGRLYAKAPIWLHPVGAIADEQNDENWKAIFYAVSKYYVLNESVSDPEKCSVVLRNRSGGIPRNANTLWISAQTSALLSGRDSIGPEDIERAYHDDGYNKLRDLADGFSYRDPVKLAMYKDVPWEWYGKIWGKLPCRPVVDAVQKEPAASNAVDACNSKEKKQRRAPRTEKSKLAASQTREKNKQKKRDELNSTLSVDDMRKNGTAKVHLAGLDASIAAREKEKGNADGRTKSDDQY